MSMDGRSSGGIRGVSSALGGRAHGSFLGPALMLVWTQCVLYARYIWVDAGLTTVAINFSRCAFIALLVLVALRGGFGLRAQRALAPASGVLMTAASFLFFLQSALPGLPAVTLAASVLAGVGVTWGEGMWIRAYMRMGALEALVYSFLSLAAFAAAGLVVAAVPEYVAFLVSMVLPVSSLMMFRTATRVLDERTGVPDEGPVPAAADDAYADEPPSTYVRLVLCIALSSFVIGASRGFPFGESIQIGPVFQAVQLVCLVLAGLLTVWLVAGRGVLLSFSALWQLQLLALAVGVVLLAALRQSTIVAGATLIAVVNLYRVAFLWSSVIEFSRHRSGSAFLVLAVVWFLHLSFREVGRLAIIALGGGALGDAAASTVFVAVLLLLVVGAMSLLVVTGDLPRRRPMFADLLDGTPQAARAAADAAGRSGCADAEAAAETGPGASAGGAGAEEAALRDALGVGYGLTAREADVALLLAQGRTAAYAADALGLATNTVRGYMREVYDKLGVHSKQELIDLVKGMRP